MRWLGYVCVLLLSTPRLHAQWGGRFILAIAEVAFSPGAGSGTDQFETFIGAGVDKRTSERTTMGLDFCFDLNGLLDDQNVSVRGTGSSLGSPSVMGTVRTTHVMFRSVYEIGNGESTALTLGPVIGMRRYTYDVVLRQPLGSYKYAQEQLTGTRITVPVGLRFGFLFDRVFFNDIYTTLAYQIGSGSSLLGVPEFPDARVPSRVIFNLSCGIGFRGNKHGERR